MDKGFAVLEIDPEFKTLIRPLRKDEYLQLEVNLTVDGCREPIITWNNIIIDGHNRYVQPILAAEKAYQIVHTGPAEVARHGDVLHAAHRHVHATCARDIAQQLRQRQPAVANPLS